MGSITRSIAQYKTVVESAVVASVDASTTNKKIKGAVSPSLTPPKGGNLDHFLTAAAINYRLTIGLSGPTPMLSLIQAFLLKSRFSFASIFAADSLRETNRSNQTGS